MLIHDYLSLTTFVLINHSSSMTHITFQLLCGPCLDLDRSHAIFWYEIKMIKIGTLGLRLGRKLVFNSPELVQ